MPRMSTFRAIMALYCGWIEQEILWCTMLSADALYMIAELYSLTAPISKCMQGRLCLVAEPMHVNLFGRLAWGGMNHSMPWAWQATWAMSSAILKWTCQREKSTLLRTLHRSRHCNYNAIRCWYIFVNHCHHRDWDRHDHCMSPHSSNGPLLNVLN